MSTPSLLRRLVRPSLALVLLLSAWLAAPNGPCAAAAPAVAAQETGAVEPVTSKFSSPREVMKEFVRVFEYQKTGDSADLEAAARTLNVAGPSATREREARRLMEQRFARILDRVAVVDPLQFADAAAVEGKDVHVAELKRTAEPRVTIELVFERVSGGGWLIARETIEHVDEMWDEVKELQPLEEFGDKSAKTAADLVRSLAPKTLQGGGILLEPYQWIALVALIVLAVIVERLLTFLLRPLIRRLSAADGLSIDIKLLHDFERPVGAIFLGIVFMLGLPALDLSSSVYDALDIAASFIVAVASVWATYRLVDVVCWNLEQRAARTDNRFDDMLVPLLRRTLKVLVLAVGIVFVASRLTDQLWHVLAGLSIGSLAVGFAAKDSIENLFGTFTVLLDNPFKLGDVVKVNDIEGTVEQVGFRSTRVRTFEDSLITVPNSRFIGQHVENFGARRKRRIKTALSLTYDTPPESIQAFCEGVREIIRRHPYTAKDSYNVWFSNYGAASLDVDLICFITTTDFATFMRERHRLFLDILRLAQDLGIGFAFPTQTIWMGKPEDLQHPDAPKGRKAALSAGREKARAVAEASLAHLEGQTPELVRFDPADPDAIEN